MRLPAPASTWSLLLSLLAIASLQGIAAAAADVKHGRVSIDWEASDPLVEYVADVRRSVDEDLVEYGTLLADVQIGIDTLKVVQTMRTDPDEYRAAVEAATLLIAKSEALLETIGQIREIHDALQFYLTDRERFDTIFIELEMRLETSLTIIEDHIDDLVSITDESLDKIQRESMILSADDIANSVEAFSELVGNYSDAQAEWIVAQQLVPAKDLSRLYPSNITAKLNASTSDLFLQYEVGYMQATWLLPILFNEKVHAMELLLWVDRMFEEVERNPYEVVFEVVDELLVHNHNASTLIDR